MPRRDAVKLTATFPAADELAKSLAKVARMADGRSGAVEWALNGACVISAESSETGKAKATVAVCTDHSEGAPPIIMGFASSYVLEFLKVAGSNAVTMALKDSNSAALLEVPEISGFTYVLMPMRV